MVHKGFIAMLPLVLVLLSAELALGSFTNARALKATIAASSCPDKKGYTTMSNINWVGTKDSQARSPDVAETTCNNDPNCVAFNSYSYYALDNPTGYTPYGGLCTYVKKGKTSSSSSCKEYFGYTTLSNTNWQGAKASQMRKPDDAKRACDGDMNCTNFNSYSYYTISTPTSQGYIPYDGLCSYIKNSKL